jgi:hypothetical protein
MSASVTWVHAQHDDPPSLVDQDFTDDRGQTVDPGNVGIAAGDVVVEGTADELTSWALQVLGLAAGYPAQAAAAPSPEQLEIEVALTSDPAGQPAVLLQLPGSWITTGADNARAVAAALVQAADTIDQHSAAGLELSST